MSHPCRNYCSQWNGEQCKGCMISDEPDFAVGDLVVPSSNAVNKVPCVREVLSINADKFLVVTSDTARSYWRYVAGWRLATPAEKAAGYRIDNPARDEVVMRADELEITPYICSICKDLTTPTQTEKSKLIPFQQVSLLEKYSRLKFNNQSLKVALAMSMVAGVVGWLL